MTSQFDEPPAKLFALEIDGEVKIEFRTKAGAERAAVELKRRFQTLQICVYEQEQDLE